MNIFRNGRKSMYAAVTVILIVSTAVIAGDWRAFDNAAFQAAKSSGKTIVLDFHADWCPTCRKQKPVLEEILKDKEFRNVVAFTIDYDSAVDLKREHNIQKQSTLLVFKGGTEVARSMGSTARNEIQDLIRKGL